jgi:hypothetical protein
MRPDGRLYLIDPYFRARLPIMSPTEVVARRLVRSVARCDVHWIRQFSHLARPTWTMPVDFLFIDGDHSYDGVRRDWDDWTPLVREGGRVALHDAHPEAAWPEPDHGPVRLLEEVTSGGWQIVEHVDSLVVLERHVLRALARADREVPRARRGSRLSACGDRPLHAGPPRGPLPHSL